MSLGVGYLAAAVAVVGLFASSAFGQVVTAFPAVKALEVGNPHGLLALLVLLLACRSRFCGSRLLGADCGGSVRGVCQVFLHEKPVHLGVRAV